MKFRDFPITAGWRHGYSRDGLESTTFARRGDGWSITGSTTAIELDTAWWVGYQIDLDAAFRTRRAVVSARTGAAPVSTISIEGDGAGGWHLDGRPLPALDGCLDVDLESSALTNGFPIRRSPVPVGATLVAPAVYVRVAEASGIAVERLEQRYVRLTDSADGPTFDYAAPAFDFTCRIEYDESALVTRYPGIADRIGQTGRPDPLPPMDGSRG